jgi:Dihaem cytochrome c
MPEFRRRDRRGPQSASRIFAVALACAATVAALGGCRRQPLPEKDSYAAHLYVRRCGNCHLAYQPHTLTAAMWQFQMNAMQAKIREAKMPPISAEQRKVILDYLTRNAGTE